MYLFYARLSSKKYKKDCISELIRCYVYNGASSLQKKGYIYSKKRFYLRSFEKKSSFKIRLLSPELHNFVFRPRQRNCVIGLLSCNPYLASSKALYRPPISLRQACPASLVYLKSNYFGLVSIFRALGGTFLKEGIQSNYSLAMKHL